MATELECLANRTRSRSLQRSYEQLATRWHDLAALRNEMRPTQDRPAKSPGVPGDKPSERHGGYDPDSPRTTMGERLARLDGQREVLTAVGSRLADVALNGAALSAQMTDVREKAECWRALIFDGNLNLVKWLGQAGEEVRTEYLLLHQEAGVASFPGPHQRLAP